MGKEERQRLYKTYLEEQGYKPEIDKDGDVMFRREGRVYFIFVSEKDDEYFQLVFPNFWKIESEEERRRVEQAAIAATAGTKVAKVYPVRDNVWATIEMFCKPPDTFKPVFERAMSALNAGVATFVEEMRK
ncbi:MAG: hypothetical protein ABIK37_06700 [candidate division WOR-3 bacterium]